MGASSMEDKAEEAAIKHPQTKETGGTILTVIEQEEGNLMVSKASTIAVLLFFSVFIVALCEVHAHRFLSSNGSVFVGIQSPGDQDFRPVDCGLALSKSKEDKYLNKNKNELQGDKELVNREKKRKHSLNISLKRRLNGEQKAAKETVAESTLRDMNRIHAFRRRIIEKKNQDAVSRMKSRTTRQLLEQQASKEVEASQFMGQLVGTLTSGASLGSGEYFMDVFVGTPPKHFMLIVDTGSDLNWIQCDPCHDCFEQVGPYYNPLGSGSFRNISCHDPRCQLVASPDPPLPCRSENQTCPYFYWYGDSSNTTGEFALETFTVNLTTPEGKADFKEVENVMFGCGHWNRGLFHGAAGLLGLGRGPLSFASQLQALYGHSFSYCLVDRNSASGISSKLIFGEDKDLMRHPELNFTSLVIGKENPADTFYYVQIKSILVGGEVLDIPDETWRLSEDGKGGTIIDSGTTLSYFADPAYTLIRDAFVKRVKGYPVVKDLPVLDPCYNVSGVEELDFPKFGIRFSDGAEWNFPAQNYLIRIDEDVVCLAILGTPRSSFSIIGNYQQQNFHVLYDTHKHRLGFAPTGCADI